MTTDVHERAVARTDLSGLTCIHRGKVRDSYALDESLMLIVATDRLSAYDVVLPDAIPGKGRILTEISNFWFALTAAHIPNHLSERRVEEFVTDPDEREQLAGRAVVVQRLEPLPVEAVVRGYLIGSGWKDYEQTGAVCGIDLPPGLRLADRLPEPLFTPATKAAVGDHDENIDFDEVCRLIGRERARAVRRMTLSLYERAVAHAAARGIIIADTKFEFGLDQSGDVVLMDEVLTPDSSRFWPAQTYRPGSSPPSYDKQFVRDYLETLDWDKTAPGPSLPAEIIRKTRERYTAALDQLTGSPLAQRAM